ncbi:MAG: diadenylate cyclase CdaA [Paludibacteraceae bacterium]|nr:diadenylate cyclase CdaA [Paludibacteraceae bacterium]
MILGIKDIIDILLVAALLFAMYRVLRRSGASNLFWGIMAFIFAWLLVSYVFNLELTGALFERFVSVGALALIVIFQEEIRAFFYKVGSRVNVERFKGKWSRVNQMKNTDNQANAIITACKNMSASKTGALIIIQQQQELTAYEETGEIIDAILSTRLIENIFFKNTPLHDGALIISNGRITSAGCILPVSKRTDLPKSYGLRHRAALGLSEKSDALIIVISEETGNISVAHSENINHVTLEELETKYIRPLLGLTTNTDNNKH